MPFKSEKQRKYLWANEPEIARDWADTYGSRIKKDDGGITQLVKNKPDGSRPGYYGSDAGFGDDDYKDAQASFEKEAQARVDAGGHGGGTEKQFQDAREQIKKPTLLQKAQNFNKTIQSKGNLGVIRKKILANKNRMAHYNKLARDLGYRIDEEEGYNWSDIFPSYKEPDFLKGDRGYSEKKIAELGARKYEPYPEVFVPGKGGISPVLNFMGDKFSAPISWEAAEGAEKMGTTLADLEKRMKGGEYISRDDLIETLGPKGFVSDVNDPRHPAYDPGGRGEGGGEVPWWLQQSAPVASVDDTTTTASTSDLGSGHFKVPDEYILAEGGRIGYDGGQLVQPGLGRPGYGGPH